ncbi:lactonase family protein [Pediococcus ethanolidurans]|uniref:lactonase family protein n=1 Tax=Pediococcus ethanolidurans TaxID=319653 RepID=UPI0021AAD44F|nr:lactonase family protein [Pediococcus ethanolidurans]MCT4397159.1 lactonase family protein [Pediococcus ethanolidurans]
MTEKTRRRSYAYVSSFSPGASNIQGSGISVLKFNQISGKLTIIQQINRRDASWMTFDTHHRFLYVCYSLRDEKFQPIERLESYRVDDFSGKLTLLNCLSIKSGPAHMTVSPDGQFLIVANYYFGNFSVWRLHTNGQIGDLVDQLQDHGFGPNPRQESAHPHSVVFDPMHHFIGTTDLGNDQISILRLVSGKLIRVCSTSLPAGTGPRHLVFSPDGKFLYTIGELDGSINSFEYNQEDGRIGLQIQRILSTPADFKGTQAGAEIMVDPTGNYLFASNRGSKSITSYQIEPQTGKLVLVNSVSNNITNPTCFTIDPLGEWLYVPNNGGRDIIQFAIDSQTGKLAETSNKTQLNAPSVMLF